ncbi:MAG: tRNA (N(6)-L-threonylcarbamoyladenosine(37)-C(2))-methylthiotransferase MtaB [Ignavibacteriaceae bacterium]|nr:tRNA (N(6)-L-threonylcarbamoyladenosine(37)-C(2))-methylthiotransferase MtaB [Ignavibacteriaceae bacterium]
MKVALHTLGCKLNYSESSSIATQFLTKNFEITDDKEHADVYVINTCTVTENAERECRQVVRRFLRQNPEAFIIVTGCYAQLRPEEISAIKGVDAVLGNAEKFDIFSLISDFRKKDLSCVFVAPIDEHKEFGQAQSSENDGRTRAYFKIQDGCDYKCTFCTIPLARGKSRSMNPDELEIEFNKLLDSGYKEIILTGVNVGDYGKSINTNLYQLLLRLIKIEGDFRIRVSSIEPNLLNDEILELTAESNKLCKHFHVPLQSGSDRILKLMQRRYISSDYKNLIFKIKNRIPDAGVGVDVIVGFPGETKEDFKITHQFLSDLPISYLHVFTYSERPDTKAINMNQKVDMFERRERNNILRILSTKKRREFLDEMIGKNVNVLFEHENHRGIMKGFSSNYVRVCHPFNSELTNMIIPMRLNSIIDDEAHGEILDTKKAVDLIVN